MQPLAHQINACNPLPLAFAKVLYRYLLCQGVDTLFLLQSVDVIRKEILIHEHTVVDVLIASNSVQLPFVGLVANIHTGIQKSATIAALPIVAYYPNLTAIVLIACGRASIIVRISPFVRVVVIDVHVKGEAFRRSIDAPYPSTSRSHSIYLLPCQAIAEKAV